MKTFLGTVAGIVVGLFVFLIVGGMAQAISGAGIVGSIASIALVILAIVGGVKAGTKTYTKFSGKTPKQLFKKSPQTTQTPPPFV